MPEPVPKTAPENTSYQPIYLPAHTEATDREWFHLQQATIILISLRGLDLEKERAANKLERKRQLDEFGAFRK